MAKQKWRESRIKGSSLGASGFTLGVLSVITLGITGVVMALVGFIFCLFQQRKHPTKLAKAGLIINTAGFALSLFWIFYLAPRLASYLPTV